MIDVTWVAWCAERLREQWPRLDGVTLEEAARELWDDETLRELGPRQAAERWLARGMPGSLPMHASQVLPSAGSKPAQTGRLPPAWVVARGIGKS
jgi:hypothetical protein